MFDSCSVDAVSLSISGSAFVELHFIDFNGTESREGSYISIASANPEELIMSSRWLNQFSYTPYPGDSIAQNYWLPTQSVSILTYLFSPIGDTVYTAADIDTERSIHTHLHLTKDADARTISLLPSDTYNHSFARLSLGMALSAFRDTGNEEKQDDAV